MSTDPLRGLGRTIPDAFTRGITALEAKGNDRAKATLADIRAAAGVIRLIVEEDGELWIAVEHGAMSVTTDRPSTTARVRFSIAVPKAALAWVAEPIQRALTDDDAAIRLASAASARIEPLLEKHVLRFHLVVLDVPDIGEVRIRAALHDAEPPAKPEFSATIRYDDIEAMRERELNLQALLMGGKVRLSGNYAPAFQLGMQLMQVARS